MAEIKDVSLLCGHCGTRQASGIFIGDTATFEAVVTSGNFPAVQQSQVPQDDPRKQREHGLRLGR
jgi:hypothetical protein